MCRFGLGLAVLVWSELCWNNKNGDISSYINVEIPKSLPKSINVAPKYIDDAPKLHTFSHVCFPPPLPFVNLLPNHLLIRRGGSLRALPDQIPARLCASCPTPGGGNLSYRIC